MLQIAADDISLNGVVHTVAIGANQVASPQKYPVKVRGSCSTSAVETDPVALNDVVRTVQHDSKAGNCAEIADDQSLYRAAVRATDVGRHAELQAIGVARTGAVDLDQRRSDEARLSRTINHDLVRDCRQSRHRRNCCRSRPDLEDHGVRPDRRVRVDDRLAQRAVAAIGGAGDFELVFERPDVRVAEPWPPALVGRGRAVPITRIDSRTRGQQSHRLGLAAVVS